MWPCIVLKLKTLFCLEHRTFSELCSTEQFLVFLHSTHHSQFAYEVPSAEESCISNQKQHLQLIPTKVLCTISLVEVSFCVSEHLFAILILGHYV
jgi:hypothetical protein